VHSRRGTVEHHRDQRDVDNPRPFSPECGEQGERVEDVLGSWAVVTVKVIRALDQVRGEAHVNYYSRPPRAGGAHPSPLCRLPRDARRSYRCLCSGDGWEVGAQLPLRTGTPFRPSMKQAHLEPEERGCSVHVVER